MRSPLPDIEVLYEANSKFHENVKVCTVGEGAYLQERR